MKPYEKALFDAFVWSRAVEESVRDLVADLFPKQHGKRDPSFRDLIEALKPSVGDPLANRLHSLRKKRNCVVHESSYVKNILVWAAEPNLHEQQLEIQGFKEVKVLAGDLYGELIDVREKLIP